VSYGATVNDVLLALTAGGLRAGHNPHDEQTAQVMKAVRDFISTAVHRPVDAAAAAA
jgi:hypothetical protein